MKPEQYDKLKLRSDQLIDVVIVEADPATWPGDGKKPTELTKDERGDRYWTKRNAAATLSLATKIQSLLGIAERRIGDTPPTTIPESDDDDADLDAELAAAEQEAATIIERFRKK